MIMKHAGLRALEAFRPLLGVYNDRCRFLHANLKSKTHDLLVSRLDSYYEQEDFTILSEEVPSPCIVLMYPHKPYISLK